MLAYQKKVTEIIGKKQFMVAQTNVKQIFANLEKKFKYYRLSLYIFSLFSSLMEILLSGNFKESYIVGIQDELREMTETYRSLFDKSSLLLQKMGGLVLQANILKGVEQLEKQLASLLVASHSLKRDRLMSFSRIAVHT